MTETEKIVGKYMTEKNGSNMNTMFEELVTKQAQLIQAHRNYIKNPGKDTKELLVESLGYVQMAITHISYVMGVSGDKLNINTLLNDKSGRKNKSISLTMGARVRRVTNGKTTKYRDGSFVRYVKEKDGYNFADRKCCVYFDGNKNMSVVRESELLELPKR